MNRAALIIIIAFIALNSCFTQNLSSVYGIKISQVMVPSGFSPFSEFQVFVLDWKEKSLSAGPFFDYKLNRIGGLSIGHTCGLKRINFLSFEPFLFYNCIYRKTKIRKEIKGLDVSVDPGIYTSLEHYFGLGLKQNVSGYMDLRVNFGYGFFLGSIMKPSKLIAGSGKSFGTNGTGTTFKIGLDFFFRNQMLE